MHLISVVIITCNEEKNIGRCLDSVKLLADEIVVLDSFSSDRTVAIAKGRGAIVKQQKFTSYIQQKNAAVSLASNDYILSLDADEALDPNLVDIILQEKEHFTAAAYYMNRCTNYCGKFIRHGSWYPDKKIRLFDKRFACWGGYDPHEKIELQGTNICVKHLKGDILHYSFPTIEEQVRKGDRYSSLSAKFMYAKGVKSNWFKILVNPFWAFFMDLLSAVDF